MCLHSAVAVEELSLSLKRRCKGGQRMTKKRKQKKKHRADWLFAAIHAHSACTSLHRHSLTVPLGIESVGGPKPVVDHISDQSRLPWMVQFNLH